jgi:ABC-type uncharacterized transport system permease subunit
MALRHDQQIGFPVQFAAGLIGSLAHIALMAVLMIQPEGIDFSLLKSVSMMLAVTVLVVSVSSQRYAIQTAQLLLMPAAAALAIFSLVAPSSRELLELSIGTFAHIILSVLAYGAFTIAAVMALLLNYLSARLKDHKLTSLVKNIPPAESLESLLFELLSLAAILLGLSIISGFIFVDDFFAQHLIHKSVLSILALIIYSTICVGHWHKGWRGRRVMRWIFGAYASLTLAYVGSKFVLEWILAS